MDTKRGIAVSPGIVIGQVFVLESEGARIPRKFIMPEEAPHEIERFRKAIEKSRDQVSTLQKKLVDLLGSDSGLGEFFHAHERMLADTGWPQRVIAQITNKNFTAEYATSEILRRYIGTLEKLGDRYIAQRTADIYDIEHRILDNLLGERREDLAHLSEPVVIVAQSLSPSQTVALDRTKILAFVTDAGGRTSHTAILARALEIPAVVGLGDISGRVSGGDTMVVDGIRGVVIINPDEETIARYRVRERDIDVFEKRVTEEVRGLPCVTTDGDEITLLANIEFPSEIATALEHGATGIGLYRTEFLYHSIDKPPDEAAHFNAYKDAMTQLGHRPIIIRLLDLGADKFGKGRREENPFLGCRSIRLLLKYPALLRMQLRAVLRASVHGNASIMLPLVTTVSEVRETRRILADVMQQLRKDGVEFNPDIEVGAMIEVPSAALMADALASNSDFFSIGTNDLTQYTLAVDRNNEDVAQLYSPADPAVVRLIRNTVEAADRHKIPVAVCGEMGSDLLFAPLLVGLGVKELSIGSKVIPGLKKFIRSFAYRDAKKIADKACENESAQENIRLLESYVKDILPETMANGAENHKPA